MGGNVQFEAFELPFWLKGWCRNQDMLEIVCYKDFGHTVTLSQWQQRVNNGRAKAKPDGAHLAVMHFHAGTHATASPEA